MESQTIVSRLQNINLIQPDEAQLWQNLANEFPYFSIAHYLNFVVQKTHSNSDLTALSTYKQNPLKFSEFVKQMRLKDAGETLVDDHSKTQSEGRIDRNNLPEENIVETNESNMTNINEVESEDISETSWVEENMQVETGKEEIQEVSDILMEINAIPEEPFVLQTTAEQSYNNTEDLTTDQGTAIAEGFDEDLDTEDEQNIWNSENKEGALPDQEGQHLMVMMSFMDWLNHFKKKTEMENEEERARKALKTAWQKEKLSAIIEEEEEEIPENIFKQAMESISLESSLISESLASLLAKQGKIDKAVDMYKKLSLRNPEKSAYFADRIKEIHLNNM